MHRMTDNVRCLIDAAEKKQRELNHTSGYAYKEVVRNKEDRKSLTATTCANCDKFHKAAGPIMPFDELGSPFSRRTRPASTCKHHQEQQQQHKDETAKQARLQLISRHRDQQQPRRASSPIDYWDPEFPDTEEIEAMRASNQAPVRP
ncbi:hypothetical protein SYNPS1DRAFT_30540 [Syncephalis pseudoplumigaleata]|uniref:DNA endonuclease activator Ctp1 C-terminal domain-containing protein n=1 Tax=Syncephalis pseudoplumigaleata TaxID=1712513 RepID=A0A4P9YV18_9FUNG|nr:hypothetical protein SYNPS1DRAFT_30540 [Syncephalis pseudoplumigaleata]|eukprot:RKP23704.1 hypothetical protein SYNPS1DRAFT_30540 [Syncephalis pseudoplumigaleata]